MTYGRVISPMLIILGSVILGYALTGIGLTRAYLGYLLLLVV